MFRTGIVLVNFNNAEDTQICLASLRASTVPYKVVVVDNDSRGDDAQQIASAFPEAEVLRSTTNVGFGRANNIGLRWLLEQTDCDYLFVLNNDTTIAPTAIAQLEQALDNDTQAGLVSPRIVVMDNPESLWYGGGYVDWRTGSAKTPGFFGSAESEIALTERYVTFVSGCAMLVRRALFEQIGGFDPRLFMYEEDVELCLRVTQAGWQMLYAPSAIVYHKGHGSQRKGTFVRGRDVKNPRLPFLTHHKTRNRLLNMHQYARGQQALTFGFYFPIWLAREFSRFVVHGRFDAAKALFAGLQAYWQARLLPFNNELVSNERSIV